MWKNTGAAKMTESDGARGGGTGRAEVSTPHLVD
jgi:hypothetical protein